MTKNESMLLKAAELALREYHKSGEYGESFREQELADIVIHHAAAAAVAAMAGGVLPGVAALIACGIATASIWSMYYRIGRYLGIGFSLDILKALASAIVSNLITQIVGILAIDLALSFVPGLSVLAAGAMNFAVVYAAGCIYLNMLAKLFVVGERLESLTADDLKAAYTEAAKKVNIKAACNEAKDTFKEMKKSGDLQKSADEAKPIE